MGKRIFIHVIFTAIILMAFGCKKYVCPAYHSAFHLGERTPELFFNYFTSDSAELQSKIGKANHSEEGMLSFPDTAAPRENDLMFAKVKRNQYRLIVKKYPLLDRLFKNRRQNFHRYVLAELDVPIADSTSTDTAMLAGLKKPEANVDQLFYDYLIGQYVIEPEDTTQSDSTQTESDSIPDKKWWQFWKKGKKKSKVEANEDSDTNPDGTPTDPANDSESTGNEVVEENTEEDPDAPKEKKKKKKKRKKKGEPDPPPPPPEDFEWN